MQLLWKRAVLSVVTVGLGVFSYTHLKMPHALAANPATPPPQNAQTKNQQLRGQLASLTKQITNLEAQVKTAQVADKNAQNSLAKAQQQAVSFQEQLKAKEAQAAQLALERSLARKATAPAVQSVTRASGSSDDGGGGGDD